MSVSEIQLYAKNPRITHKSALSADKSLRILGFEGSYCDQPLDILPYQLQRGLSIALAKPCWFRLDAYAAVPATYLRLRFTPK